MESGKETGVPGLRGPGLRGPVPALRMGPTRGVASGRTAARMPPALSARGPRPAAPAAPSTRRAALVTGGGGLGDPGGLGVARPEGREAGVRAAAPALDLSLLSILHLMRRQTGQHPRSWTVTQPAGTCSWQLATPSPASPPIGAQTSASIHFPLTHPHMGRDAYNCPQVPPPSPSTRPCLPQPAPTPTHPLAFAPFQDLRSTPLPLAASGTGGCHRLQMGWGGGDRSARPGPLASPEGCRHLPGGATPAARARARGDKEPRLKSVPLPQPDPVRAAPSTCCRRADLPLGSPAAPRRVAWGGAGWQRLGGRKQRTGERRGVLQAVAPGAGPAPPPRSGETRAHAPDPDPGGGGSAPGWCGGRRALEGGEAAPRLRQSTRYPTRGDSEEEGIP